MRPNLAVKTARIDLKHSPKTYHIPSWATMNDKQKMALISRIIHQYGRDPAVVKVAMGILKRAKVQPRDYRKQAEVFLKWVQQNIYYINEPGERLQSPKYTLQQGYGDCDDLVIILCSFFEAVRLPWKLVISGRGQNGKMIRYHQGDPVLPQAQWAHIYCMVGIPPYRPTQWFYCEPTMEKPLGWDVVQAKGGGLPELQNYGQVTGSIAATTSQAATAGGRRPLTHYVRDIFLAVIIGATTAVVTQLILDRVRTEKWYRKHIRQKGKK